MSHSFLMRTFGVQCLSVNLGLFNVELCIMEIWQQRFYNANLHAQSTGVHCV